MTKKVVRIDRPEYTIHVFASQAGIECVRSSLQSRRKYYIELPILNEKLGFDYHKSLNDFLLRTYKRYTNFLKQLGEKDEEL